MANKDGVKLNSSKYKEESIEDLYITAASSNNFYELKKNLNKSLKNYRHRNNVRFRRLVEEIANLELRMVELEKENKKSQRYCFVCSILLIVTAVSNIITMILH